MKNKKQIFFLHFAGGNCFSFNFLAPLLSSYEVHQLELPGRGKRVQQSFALNRETAVADYTEQIMQKMNGAEMIIYGHSMGATLGIEVVSRLEKNKVFPMKLIVSGNPGPGASVNKQRSQMPKDEFLTELKDIGGMPEEFFKHPELVEYYIPILKSDFRLCEEKDPQAINPVETPILALMGSEEEKVHEIENWKRFTRSDFQSEVFDGNHFFIHKHVKKISELIHNCHHLTTS